MSKLRRLVAPKHKVDTKRDRRNHARESMTSELKGLQANWRKRINAKRGELAKKVAQAKDKKAARVAATNTLAKLTEQRDSELARITKAIGRL
jgi:hypothetical protein